MSILNREGLKVLKSGVRGKETLDFDPVSISRSVEGRV